MTASTMTSVVNGQTPAPSGPPTRIGVPVLEQPQSEEPTAQLPRGPDVPGVLSSPYMDFNRNRVYDDLDRMLATSLDAASFPVLVMMTQPVTDATLGDLHAQLGDFPVTATWTVVNGFAASMTKPQVLQVALRSDVVQVEYDHMGGVAMDSARKWYGVDKAVTDYSVTGDRDGANKTYTKNDVVICILDTGIDTAHSDLNEGKLIAWFDYVNSQSTAYDDNGHGTHVSSIAAGEGDANWGYRGVAYAASLVVVKIFDSAGNGAMSRMVSGINWCINNRTVFNIKIMSISGGYTGCWDGTDTVATAVNSAYSNGILPVIAAGNEGPGTCTVRTPGVASNALTVCSIADVGEGGYFIDSFSGRGPTADGRVKPDICGPGNHIAAAQAGTTTGYVNMTGTSMATPFVAGVAALMLDANNALTPAQLKSEITGNHWDFAASGTDSDVGSGLLTAYYAIRQAAGGTGSGPTEPNHYQTTGPTIGATGAQDEWQFQIQSTANPLAVTITIPSASATKNFDLYVYFWNGSSWVLQASSTTSSTREEQVSIAVPSLGTYDVLIYSAAGSGNYYMDISDLGNTPTLTHDG